MNQEIVMRWLQSWAKRQVAANLGGGLLVFVAGIALVMVTWGFSYLVSLFALGPWLGYRHWALWVVGAIFIPLLFWGNARTSRGYLSTYEVTCATASDRVVNFYLPGVGMCSNVNPLAPQTIHTGAKMITDVLYSAPRVLVYSIKLFQKSARLRQLDLWGCSAVLTVLLSARRKLSFQEIVNSIEGLDPVRVFPQMHDVEGVMFLNSDPSGLSLSPELKEQLLAAAKTAA